MVFPVTMDGCENWTVKKAVKEKKIHYSEMWCQRRALWRSWTARKTGNWVLDQITSEL